MQEFLEIGQIVNTFGIKGFVKVNPFTDNMKLKSKRLNIIKIWYLLNLKVLIKLKMLKV